MTSTDVATPPTHVRTLFAVAAVSLMVLAGGCSSDATSADNALADTAVAETLAPNGANAGAALPSEPQGKQGLSNGAYLDARKWADSLVREICKGLTPADIVLLAQRTGIPAEELREMCGIAPTTLPGGKTFTDGPGGAGRPQVVDGIVSDLCKAMVARGNPSTMQILAGRLGVSAESLWQLCLPITRTQ